MLKTTIVWSMSCFIGIFYIQDALKQKDYFWKILKKNLYPTIFLGHILNEHTFCYGIELLTMIPLFIIIFLEISNSKIKKKRSLSIMLIGSVLIVAFFSNSIFYIFKHPNVYFTIDYLKSLFLITILSIFFMPFQYLFAVYLAYDSFLTNTNYVLEENPELYSYIRKYVLLKCMINFEKINKINSQLHVYTTINEEIAKREIDQILKKDEQL